MALIYRNINNGDQLPLHRMTLKTIAAHQLEDKHPAPHINTTVFNVLRALIQVLVEDLHYLTGEHSRLLEYLIDKNDVSVGAAFEVYLQTEDIEDLTHSLLTILKAKHFPMVPNESLVEASH